MLNPLTFAVAALTLAGTAWAQSSAYGQCGGQGWSGATTCVSGYTCVYSNAYYSQCLPGSSSGSATTTTPSTGSSGSSTATSTSAAASGTTTLVAGWSFIRAVEEPYFHQYLQSNPLNSAGTAVLGSPATAGQFQVDNGQLVYNGSGTTLYAQVAGRTNSSEMYLAVSWATTPASGANAGTFSWSGDTLEWNISTIDRPQTNAWYVCPDAHNNLNLYVNLGYYDYGTPAGCADETIHAYTGATATP